MIMMMMKHSSNRLKYLVLGIVFFVLGIGDGIAQVNGGSFTVEETVTYNATPYSNIGSTSLMTDVTQ